MTIKEAFDKLDKSEENRDKFINIWKLHENLFGYYSCLKDVDDEQNFPLKCYWLKTWLCTDTWVGYKAYFLNDEPVAISEQLGRKDYETFSWMSKKSYDDVVKFLKSLEVEDEYTFNHNTLISDKVWNLEMD